MDGNRCVLANPVEPRRFRWSCETTTVVAIHELRLEIVVGTSHYPWLSLLQSGGSVSDISLSTALNQLAAENQAGGAEVSFGDFSRGSAVVAIDAAGGRRFTIRDGMGRTVLTGILLDDNTTTQTAAAVHDRLVSLGGDDSQDVLVAEPAMVDALGNGAGWCQAQ